MSIIHPKFISIDSSLIGKWAADACSADISKRKQAYEVMDQILSDNWIPVICWHHFEELVRHNDENIAESRIKFIMSFPIIAWIWRADGTNHLGSVADVLAAEIEVFLSGDNLDHYINSTRSRLLRFGKPSDVQTFAEWRDIWLDLIALGKKQQHNASLSHTTPDKYDNEPLFARNDSGDMTFEKGEQIYSSEIESLTNELIEKGDKRLSNHEAVARDFFDVILFHLAEISRSKKSAPEAFIEQFGFSPNEFHKGITLGEFKRIVTRRKQLETSARQLGLRIEDVWPKLRHHVMPSEEIIYEIRRSRRNAPRASGSDLNDDYLASLIPYLDAVVVDKRTHEHLRQVKRRKPEISYFLKSIFKTCFYHELPQMLKSIRCTP
jgi:hypothetical protein